MMRITGKIIICDILSLFKWYPPTINCCTESTLKTLEKKSPIGFLIRISHLTYFYVQYFTQNSEKLLVRDSLTLAWREVGSLTLIRWSLPRESWLWSSGCRIAWLWCTCWWIAWSTVGSWLLNNWSLGCIAHVWRISWRVILSSSEAWCSVTAVWVRRKAALSNTHRMSAALSGTSE